MDFDAYTWRESASQNDRRLKNAARRRKAIRGRAREACLESLEPRLLLSGAAPYAENGLPL